MCGGSLVMPRTCVRLQLCFEDKMRTKIPSVLPMELALEVHWQQWWIILHIPIEGGPSASLLNLELQRWELKAVSHPAQSFCHSLATFFSQSSLWASQWPVCAVCPFPAALSLQWLSSEQHWGKSGINKNLLNITRSENWNTKEETKWIFWLSKQFQVGYWELEWL